MSLSRISKLFLQSIFGAKAAEATVEWWKFDQASGKVVGRQASRAVSAAPLGDDAVYWSVGLMRPGCGRSNANVVSVHALVADDVGTKVDREMVDLFMPAPTEIVESSSGNFQYVWAVPSGMSVAEHQALWAGMETVLGVRMDGSDPGHLFRLPEGVNGKPGKTGFSVTSRGHGGGDYGFVSLAALLPAGAGPGLRGSGAHVAGIAGGGSSPQAAPSVEALEKLLELLPNDGDDYDYWIDVGIGCWGCSGGAEWGFSAWEKWSRKSPVCGVVHQPEDKWATFGGTVSAGWGALEIKVKETVGGGRLAAAAFDDGEDVGLGSAGVGTGVVRPLEAEQRRIAAHIERTLGGEIRWNAPYRKWMVFSGDIWDVVDYDVGFWAAAQWAAGVPQKVAQTAGFAEGVSKHLRNTPAMIVTDGDFNRGAWLAGVPGGTLNLTTGAMRPARASDMISRQMAVAPDAAVGCPLWLKFLGEACSGDQGMIDFLQRWAGYCLTGDVRLHKFVYLWGPGGNGKSLFVETLKRMMGSYGVQAASDLFVKKTQKGHPDALARLAGARLVVVPEISGGEKWDVDLLKEVTGNELMVARFMYGSNFTFPVTFKLMSTGNHQPSFPGGINPAIERRFIYGQFENKPAAVDVDLAEKFRPEMPGIMAWALQGLRVGFKARGLDVPQSMADAARAYFDESDVILKWKAECLEEARGEKVTMAELFKSWSAWSLQNGVHEWQNLSAFSKMIRNKGLFVIVKRDNVSTINGWKIKPISVF